MSQSSQETAILTHDGAPLPGTMSPWLAGIQASSSQAIGVPHVQLFSGMHDAMSGSSSQVIACPRVPPLVIFTPLLVDLKPRVHRLMVHLHMTTRLVVCISSDMMMISMMEISVGVGVGVERGVLHLVALVDV
ncbi:hypothetical protein PIB30_017343 [Stylosanthes scabra]|uniref:Uncharacterized protein n=1 Tax=Stylosanthes scabra TaxID=79078 RepID=A0ABU6T7A6_9FABA|nr:hypothetical protein [Stylosanthes scabra]